MSDFNYKDKSSPKLNDDFKKQFVVNIKGKEAIKVEGLTAIAHEKGMWKLDTKVVQFPSKDNDWTCICQCTVGGYDWDPAEQKIVRVEYTDIADANAGNVTSMVAKSYIRMASTRAIGRALRKYTNVDILCSSEMDSVVEDAPEPSVTVEQLTEIKSLLGQNRLDKESFIKMLKAMFGKENHMLLTQTEGNRLIAELRNMQANNSQQQ